jgi:hypothetical protein
MHKVILNISHKYLFAFILIVSAQNSMAQMAALPVLKDPFDISASSTGVAKTAMPPLEIAPTWVGEVDTNSNDPMWMFPDASSHVFQHSPLATLSSPNRNFDFLNYATPRDPMRLFRKRFFWGIAFAGTQAKMKMELDPVFWQRTDSIKSIRPGGQLGGGFGGSVAMRIGRFWEVKMLTMLQLHERTLQYTWQYNPGPNLKIETISLDIPITLKYRSTMPDNTGMYVIGGLRWSHDFQSNEDVPIGDTKPLVAIKKNTFYYEMGAGFEFRLDFVDLSLEFKLSNGLNNALVRIPNSYYSGSLSAIYPRLFSISLMAQD